MCALVAAHVLVSLLAPRGVGLTAFGDLTQSALLFCATLFILAKIRSGSKKAQLFWLLMGVGCAMWFLSQALWTYFEVFLRQDTPNPFVGDVILFLHIVPMMAALAVQPHVRQNGRSLRLVSLDFFLLLAWWLYLYLFIVIPWQYVSPDEAAYGHSFDLLYACEQVVLILGVALVWKRSVGAWRNVYRGLFRAAFFYSLGSILAGVAIDFHKYYTGSLFDVPLVAAIAWFVGLGFSTVESPPDRPLDPQPRQHHSIWTARLSMMAVLSTPLMLAWAEFAGAAPARVRSYRLFLSIAACSSWVLWCC